ncbi:dystrobrevin beta isoform X4 [Octopus sinensis]|uniref:Dystrobrevin beta isoform X4 n=1 Tax=Octopus sinensis TaxID=2607531 RepID=A0A7E6F1I2_9MOLL|nr:dystrobrevin beta isoform X4 [Octopus sinensis]
MTECLAYNPQNNFASVIENINRELREKGHLAASDDSRMLDDTSPTTRAFVEHKQLMTELRSQNYDVIRFATYRTACKLRFIQKRTNLLLVDIWNIIEAFRENGLNTLEPDSELNVSRLETILSSIFHQLNKRLPSSQQISVDQSVNLLLNWLISAYDREHKGRILVFSLKVSLSHLCTGKLMDKLRYIFTQISDSSGYQIQEKFEEYLRAVLALPSAVCEGPSFGYNDTASRTCFDGKILEELGFGQMVKREKVNVNDFLNVLMSDPGPQCLMWLPILHRMSQAENAVHPVQCEGCNRESFMGFRYKCQRCYNYQLCQDCFWRGRTSGNHTDSHEMKEYLSYGSTKSPAKQIGHSLKKSFRCVPSKPNHKIPTFSDVPENRIDLTNIVPPTPVMVHNDLQEACSHSIDLSSVDSGPTSRSPSKLNASIGDTTRIDDEHRLIVRYAARLAADASNAARSPAEMNFSLDSSKAQRELIAQLEAKNREIMREIQRLRMEQEANAKNMEVQYDPTLLAELRLLRQRKDELEARMQSLQESRKELMVQLEGLMKLLKNHSSPRSTPNSSPRSRGGGHSPIAAVPSKGSSPSTPMDALTGLGIGGDIRQAFSQVSTAGSPNVRNLRNDLLVAADSVTNAMSSLVKELNSEGSGSEDESSALGTLAASGNLDIEAYYPTHTSDDVDGWRDEVKRRLDQESEFLAQLRARRQKGSNSSSRNQSDSETDPYIPDDCESYGRTEDDASVLVTDDGESYIGTNDGSRALTDDDDSELYDNHPKELVNRYMTDDESYLQSDAESYIRTDDEEGGNTEWEESMRRWVNR